MSPSELEREPEPSPVPRGWQGRNYAIVALASIFAGSVGYVVASALGYSTTCATGRSPLTFALLLGFTAALAAASGLRRQK
ncbi:MAG TPA: hypothetical protein VIV60_01640 [Polyangiaceae bacterium]